MKRFESLRNHYQGLASLHGITGSTACYKDMMGILKEFETADLVALGKKVGLDIKYNDPGWEDGGWFGHRYQTVDRILMHGYYDY